MMDKARQPVVLCVLCMLPACIGCTVGPDYHRPEMKTPPAWGESPVGRTTTQPAQLAAWWKHFNDPMLEQLIEQAISGNLNLRQAQSRIRQARAQRGIAAASLWPTADATGSYERIRFSRNAISGSGAAAGRPPSGTPSTQPSSRSTGAGGGINEQNLYQAGFDASWEIDVFGGLRRGVESAEASLAASVEDQRDVLVTLLAEVGLNYVELRGFQRQLVVAKENLQAQQETLELTRNRYDAGLSTGLEVAQAEAQIAGTAAQLPGLETSIRQTIHMLSVLTGKEPMALVEQLTMDTPIPSPPPEIPVGMPSDVLRQRADIRRAERQLAAATAQIGVAVADLYPRFFLTGNVGYESSKTSNFFTPDSFYWSAQPSVRWRIFDAGSVRFNIASRVEQQQQLSMAYEQTILTALQEVEDALVAYAQEQIHRQALIDAVQANRNAMDIAMQLYMHGRTDFLNVLVARRTLYASQDALVQSERTLATDVVVLYKALGGGWDIAISNADSQARYLPAD